MKTKLVIINIVTLLAFAMVILRGQGSGPLDPPAAPADGVYRTLEEIHDVAADPRTPITALPFTISTPGSYYLRGNLTFASATGHAITVNVSNVTIDLNGFTLSSTSAVTGKGIHGATGVERLTVRNGFIEGQTVDPESPAGFENGIGGDSLRGWRVSDLSVSGCRTFGIDVGSNGFLERCVAQGNGHHGLVNSYGVISRCVSQGNGGSGIWGISSSIQDCAVHGNGGSGIHSPSGNVSGCSASQNGVAGIRASIVTASRASGNKIGIEASVISQSVATGSTEVGLTTTSSGGIGAISLSFSSSNSPDIETIGTRTGNHPAP